MGIGHSWTVIIAWSLDLEHFISRSILCIELSAITIIRISHQDQNLLLNIAHRIGIPMWILLDITCGVERLPVSSVNSIGSHRVFSPSMQ